MAKKYFKLVFNILSCGGANSTTARRVCIKKTIATDTGKEMEKGGFLFIMSG